MDGSVRCRSGSRTGTSLLVGPVEAWSMHPLTREHRRAKIKLLAKKSIENGRGLRCHSRFHAAVPGHASHGVGQAFWPALFSVGTGLDAIRVWCPLQWRVSQSEQSRYVFLSCGTLMQC